MSVHDKTNLPDESPAKLLLAAALKKLKDKDNNASKVEGLVQRINKAGGFPQRRRLSLRDNDIVATMTRVMANDPSTTDIKFDNDPRFAHVPKSTLLEFAESLRTNLHVTSLCIKGCDLDNGFLSALATSIESNFTLDTIVLSGNAFTSDALVEFCQAMGENESIRRVDLRKQTSPILGTADEVVMEALKKNRRIEKFRVETKTTKLKDAIKNIVERNEKKPVTIKDYDKKLIDHLEKEAVRAEELQKQRQLEAKVLNTDGEDDWEYLHRLSILANKYKLQEIADDETETPEQSGLSDDFKSRQDSAKSMLGVSVNFTADGAFLTDEFISQYLEEDEECGSLAFAFQTQYKLFKRFPIGDKKRRFISEKFADTLVDHPRAKDITHINMANTGVGDEWLERLCERCLADPTLLPNLHMLNMETNYLSTAGVVALSKCLSDPKTWTFIQAVKLENQRQLISSRAELELAKALCMNKSVIRLSLRIRNLWERNQANKFVSRNMDFLRQARLKHAIKTGTKTERARNKMEELFDQVAANDEKVTEVEVVGNQLFLSLPKDEVIKAAKAFANNTHVKTVRMTMLRLNDDFACAFAKSIESGCVIEKLILDSNSFTGNGIEAIVASLAKNQTITELQLRHQAKPMGTAAEESLRGLLGGNETLGKLGVDVRSTRAQNELERKMADNRELARVRRHKERSSITSSVKAKPKGKMQLYFGQIADDDASISEVEIVGDKLFLSMKSADKVTAMRSLATNTHVKKVKMAMLELDDECACALAESMEQNSSIEKLVVDSNMIGSKGIKALIGSLAKNKSIAELQVRHQKKPLPSSDEEALPALLGDNKTVTKLGVDLRSPRAQRELDNIVSRNRDLLRKARRDSKD